VHFGTILSTVTE